MATSNLKTHALKCFGADAVAAATDKQDASNHDGSVFASFAHVGQQPVKFSHHTHTTEESWYILKMYLIIPF